MSEPSCYEPASDLTPGKVVGVDSWALGNTKGTRFAVSRRCRHLRADLAKGSIDDDGCLVCPWHGARYDVTSGKMVDGPQGVFKKIPGLSGGFKAFSKIVPLKTGEVVENDGTLEIKG